ncbi:MAG: TraB/GumN family protein [Sphingorhabdus sp.]
MTVARFFAMLLLLLLAGCSSEGDQSQIVTEQSGKPALWKVTAKEGTGGTAWLFGTVHLLPEGTDWQGPLMDEAIRSSDGLVMEVTGLDDQRAVEGLFSAMGVNHDMPRLADRVGASERPGLDKAINAASVPVLTLDNMETWAAALTLSASISDGLGLSREAGVEQVLQHRYTADQKPVQGLETIQQQFSYFDTLPEKEQRAMLSVIVEGVGESRTKFQKMLDAWMAGDVDNLLTDANDGLLTSPLIRETLLDGRNRRWSDAIGKMIDRSERPFVAVGAGHMVGKGGMPELLSAKGYVVVRIQ